MSDSQTLARLHDEENRGEFAIRRQERRLEAEERELERRLEELREAEEQAEREIEAEWRRERWGHDPDRPPAWRVRAAEASRRPQPARSSRSSR